MGNEEKKPLWKMIIVRAIVPTVVGIFVAVFVGFARGGFQGSIVWEILRAHWSLFVIVIGMVAIMVTFLFLVDRYRTKALVIGLLVISYVFILSSWKGVEISEAIRWFISRNFDVGLLAGGITIMGLALGIAGISKEKRK